MHFHILNFKHTVPFKMPFRLICLFGNDCTLFRLSKSIVFESMCDDTDYIHHAKKITYKYFAPSMCAFGIVGAILNLMTLFSDGTRFNTRVYTYFKALSIYDLGFLSFALSVTSYSADPQYNPNHNELFYTYLLGTPIVNAFLSSSVYVVVCLTLDRWENTFEIHLCNVSTYIH